jgi:hypothetical protein
MVTFNDGGVSIGSSTLLSGSATFATSNLLVGTHAITVSYAGDSNFTTSASGTLLQTVNQDGSTSSVTSSTNPTFLGQMVTFTATVSANGPGSGTPSGTVMFNDDGASIGSGTLSGGTATFATSDLSVGTHTITVSYAGDSNFTASASGNLLQTVNQDGSMSSVTSSANPTVFGQMVTFTATVLASAPGAGTPTGTVTFNDGGISIGSGTLSGGRAAFATSSLSAGTHTITVSYSGDSNFTGSLSSSIAQTVNQTVEGTTTMLASSADPSVFGQSVTFTATVTPTSGSGTPTGTVTFKDGAATLGTALLSSGRAMFSTSSLAVGNHSITASYGGDPDFTGSASIALTQTVTKDSTTTTLTSSANPSLLGQAVTFTATVAANAPGSRTPTGTVTFKSVKTTLATVVLDGTGHAAFTTSSAPAGTVSVTAVYNGDGNFLTSTGGIVQTVISNKSSTTTTIASSLNPSKSGQAVTFTATVTPSGSGRTSTPTGTVTFFDGKITLGTATLSGAGIATLTKSNLSVGNHQIFAKYGGDSNFNSSTSPSLTQTVTAATTATILVSQDLGLQDAFAEQLAQPPSTLRRNFALERLWAARAEQPPDVIWMLYGEALNSARVLEVPALDSQRTLRDTVDALFGGIPQNTAARL